MHTIGASTPYRRILFQFSFARPTAELIAKDEGFVNLAEDRGWTVERVLRNEKAGVSGPSFSSARALSTSPKHLLAIRRRQLVEMLVLCPHPEVPVSCGVATPSRPRPAPKYDRLILRPSCAFTELAGLSRRHPLRPGDTVNSSWLQACSSAIEQSIMESIADSSLSVMANRHNYGSRDSRVELCCKDQIGGRETDQALTTSKQTN
jgi:hypothetical protein